MSDSPTPGRRERKKAATRQAIADAALELFLEHGFDRVSVRDVAERADVSTTTLFAHFPSKEALVFDREADVDAALAAAVRERPEGQGVVEALRTMPWSPGCRS
ncbi:TetR/AcrR family transcriptional regulator OS=Streptomyces tendae OX=1932 GN=GUR47_06055 PE=4 SV=1 [Streptomyces tendae]